MDVKCNRCGTDYEFEETLVSPRGTTVKCTTCGHLFKVFRGSSQEPAPADDARPWLVRRRNGEVEPLVSLGDLTRMIGRQEITPDDEISRSGQAWKKLGEIAELQSFFDNPKRAQAALSATPPLGLESPSTRPPRNSDAPLPIGVGSMPPVSRTEITQTDRAPTSPPSQRPNAAADGLTATPRSSTRPAAPRPAESARAATLKLTVDEPPGDQHTPHERPSARSRARARQTASDPGRTSAPAASPQAAPSPPSSRPPAVPSTPPAAPPRGTVGQARPTPSVPPPRSPATESPAIRVEKRFPWGRVTTLVALVGLGMGAYFWGRKLAVEPAPKTPPASPFITRADAELAAHDVRRFSDAVTDYTKALAFEERDVTVIVRLSRTYAVWADALDNVAQWDPVRAIDARVERKRHVANARRQAEVAVGFSPRDVEALVALADALRLNGEINAARAELARAGEPSDAASAETLRVAALLAAAESDGDQTRAIELATRALEKDRELIRAELLLAKLLLASGEIAASREHVRAILAAHPSHRLAEMLLAAIEAKAVAPNVASANTRDAGDTAVTPDAAILPGTAAVSSDPAAAAPRAVDELPNTYEELIRRGDALLERGATKLAKAAFEKALSLRPGAAPALTGLGYLALEKGDAAGAIRLFTPASNAGHGDAFIGLGDASRQLGRHNDALRAYESYLSRYPTGPRSSIARRQVERLREQATRAAQPSTPSGFPPMNQPGAPSP